MDSVHLYTVIIKVYDTQEVFIDQVRTSAKSLDKILFASVEQAVAHGVHKELQCDAEKMKKVLVNSFSFNPSQHMIEPFALACIFYGQYILDALYHTNNRSITMLAEVDIKATLCICCFLKV